MRLERCSDRPQHVLRVADRFDGCSTWKRDRAHAVPRPHSPPDSRRVDQEPRLDGRDRDDGNVVRWVRQPADGLDDLSTPSVRTNGIGIAVDEQEVRLGEHPERCAALIAYSSPWGPLQPVEPWDPARRLARAREDAELFQVRCQEGVRGPLVHENRAYHPVRHGWRTGATRRRGSPIGGNRERRLGPRLGWPVSRATTSSGGSGARCGPSARRSAPLSVLQ